MSSRRERHGNRTGDQRLKNERSRSGRLAYEMQVNSRHEGKEAWESGVWSLASLVHISCSSSTGEPIKLGACDWGPRMDQ